MVYVHHVQTPPASFLYWAAGDLTNNRMRGLFAEWLLASRLGVLDDQSLRFEWDKVDIRFGEVRIEVKTSGTRQQWGSETSAPRFSIAPQKSSWDKPSNQVAQHDTPQRSAHLYVFCLHDCVELTNESVLDEDNWRFWVIPTQVLDQRFANQKSLGLNALSEFSERTDLAGAIDQIRLFQPPSA